MSLMTHERFSFLLPGKHYKNSDLSVKISKLQCIADPRLKDIHIYTKFIEMQDSYRRDF